MLLPLKHSRFVLCTFFFCLFALVSCAKTPPTDPRADFIGSLKGANLDGFIFETRDTDEQEITSMTNRVIDEPIKMDSDGSVVIRYTRMRDKKTNTITTYKGEVIRSGDQLTLRVTDLVTGAEVIKETADFPGVPAGATCGLPEFPPFKNSDDCLCSLRASLQFEANRTCTTQSAGTICCIGGNQLISIHIFAVPTSFRCSIVFSGIFDLVLFRD